MEKEVVIKNPLGLHVRPSAALAQAAGRFRSKIEIQRDGLKVNAKSSLDLLTLAAIQGVRLKIRAEGDDAEAALQAVVALIESGFGEE